MVEERSKSQLKIDHQCRCGWYVVLKTGRGDSAWNVFEQTLRAIKAHEAGCERIAGDHPDNGSEAEATPI